MLSTPPELLVEGILTVSGDGPADLDPGRLNDVGEVETPASNNSQLSIKMDEICMWIVFLLPVLKSRLRTESARGIAEEKAFVLEAEDVWRVNGLAAAKRDVV